MARSSGRGGVPPAGRRLVAASAVLALGAVTACGGDGGGDPDTLSLWIMEGTNPDAASYAAELGAAFEERTGVGLDVQFIQWADAHDRITTAMAGGELPDVAEIGTTWAPEFGAAGALADLAPRIEADGLGEDLLPGLYDAGTVDGATYGMPWYAGVRALLYRADVFAEHDLRPPTTWEELREVGLALREAEPEMIPFPVAGGSEYGLDPFIWGAGGEIAEPDGDGGWRATVNEPEAVEGIAFYTSLATEHGLSVAAAETWLETDQLESFQNGEAAMVINGNWTVTTLVESDPGWAERIGVVPIPGPEGGLSPSFVGGSLLGDFQSADPDLAWELISLMTQGEFAGRWAESSGYFPGRQSLVEEVRAAGEPLVAPFARQMLEAGASLPVTDRYGTIQGEQLLPRMLQSILSGEATVREAADEAAAAMDETFAG
ncbi:carbohydrate ABC transporter substrate-binding protein, CUT1 family [Streptomyces zhaozhouensis]|uniref:Carbohydrate ABC transporter substrate-binding protein, CUT1 family n=1 Tax=Streptomyces zhaozhouensis TaxID=1300267 RepID=A0A286DIG7_9ACTN|nr:extracellular solute-binding protein [Streptomyces zhaozhouensis]SOD58525.1 carbohydrate ABC transporter substrate-binding protein, CUT1 family [Streptomyces zhaozhouensis]